MPPARINKVEIQGFRAFGAKSQTLALSPTITAVWGPNSKGKTSLAEAFEFLLTGAIVRRELLASAKDEFADSLRNAHIPAQAPVYISAEIVDTNGVPHTVVRTLTADYGKRQDCQSTLEIDGKPATEQELLALGITLSQPPLRAPVLAQHTLGYLFSARPQDRAAYFKALREVTDLDAFRTAVAALESALRTPDLPALTQLAAAAGIAEATPALAPLRTKAPAALEVAKACAAATAALIAANGETVPADAAARLTRVEEILADKRARTFPVKALEKQPPRTWAPPAQSQIDALTTYIAERRKVDEETRRLAALFSEALALPAVAAAAAPIECPLCATPAALTPHRIAHIRERLRDTETFRAAEKGARDALQRIAAAIDTARTLSDDPVPKFMLVTPKARRSQGFSLQRIRELLGPGGASAIAAWLPLHRRLARARAGARRRASTCHRILAGYAANLDSLTDTAPVKDGLEALAAAVRVLHDELPRYLAAERDVAEPLKAVVDAASKTTAWAELIAIARDQPALHAALVDAAIYDQARKELDQTLREIERGNAAVLDRKFADLSASVARWWNMLRPDEPSFFSALGQRAGAVRTVDFKAGLSENPDRSSPKVRDVVAVFSQSQLHCLGLALFLARAEHEGAGFIVLDDPVLSSDEDYRVHFNSTVLAELQKLPVQSIVLTQDHGTWEELETRYRHLGIANAQIFIEAPGEGTVIENTSDALLAKISRATSLARGGHPDSRKECGIHLRDAGERFCKEMLVRKKHRQGDTTVSLDHYEGKVLEWLCPRVEPLLDRDPAHPGQLEVFKNTVNRACHDNAPPGTEEMKKACGDLLHFVKEYLGR
jgi:hypothetical protein